MFDVTLSIPYGGGMKIDIGLDVTDPEPLPDEHPLWSMSNVIITPHTANTMNSMDRLLAPVVAANYRALVARETMPTGAERPRYGQWPPQECRGCTQSSAAHGGRPNTGPRGKTPRPHSTPPWHAPTGTPQAY